MKSVVGKSQVILSLSIAALVGYFAISDRSLMDMSILELIGLGAFLLGTVPFLFLAFRNEKFDNHHLKWSLRNTTIEYTTRIALLSISNLAGRLTILREAQERMYKFSLCIWAASLIFGVIMVVVGLT